MINKILGYIKHYELEQYIGQTMNGVEITLSGLCAAIHLVGIGDFLKAIRSGDLTSVKDGNGTTPKEYMEKFGGYDLYDR